MKESLAARQAALLRQNAELDQKVEAIEQRRQQQLHRTASGTVAAVAPPAEAVLSDGDIGGGYDDESDAASSPDRAQLRKHLSMDPSESLDSTTADKAAEQPEEVMKSESKPTTKPSPTRRRSQIQKKKSTGPEMATASARKHQQQGKRPKSAHVEIDNNVDVGQSVEAKHEEPPSPDAKPSGGGGRGGDDDEDDGLGLEATVRYQKARLRVLQDELESTQVELKEMQTAQQQLKAKIEELTSDNGSLKKKHQQTLQLLEKQQELSAAQESKQKILETQLSAAQTKMEEIQKAEKQASQQFRSKDVRLNRALEELEKAKAQLQEERRTHGEQMIAKGEYEQVVKDNKRLEKQKNELLLAFKKQMKLIDLLKRQRIHMEAAKMLSFTEEEFSKTLELG